jgi:hypothetical protein
MEIKLNAFYISATKRDVTNFILWLLDSSGNSPWYSLVEELASPKAINAN